MRLAVSFRLTFDELSEDGGMTSVMRCLTIWHIKTDIGKNQGLAQLFLPGSLMTSSLLSSHSQQSLTNGKLWSYSRSERKIFVSD